METVTKPVHEVASSEWIIMPTEQEMFEGYSVGVSRQEEWRRAYYRYQKGGDVVLGSTIPRVAGNKLMVKVLTGIPDGMPSNKALQGRMHSTVGSDPEVFLTNKGELLPAWEVLPTKQQVWGSSPFWDGFQAEFRTPPGDTCLQVLSTRIREGLEATLYIARKTHPATKLSTQSVFEVSPPQLVMLPQSYVELGCTPSLNAYGHEPVNPGDPRELMYRFAGGHIHLGTKQVMYNPNVPLTEKQHINAVKGMDALLGVMSVAMFERMDNPIRRKYYGRAGEYRLPKHGLEYRVLSNAWLVHPVAFHICFMLARAGAQMGAIGLLKNFGPAEEEVQEIINNCDARGARKLIEKHKGNYKAATMVAVEHYRQSAAAVWKATFEGIEGLTGGEWDIEKSWGLVEPNSRDAHDRGYPMELSRLTGLMGNKANVSADQFDRL